MVFLFTVGTVAGILLGLRFKVFALGPAILIATVFIILMGHGLRVIVFTEVGTVVLLQVGYIAGCVFPAVLEHIWHHKRLRDESARSKLGWPTADVSPSKDGHFAPQDIDELRKVNDATLS